jgi:palmitoyltransferase ZDHHC13/17
LCSKTNERNGHVYIVHLLLQYGADPLLCDAQGFNTLHLATISSEIMLIVYLLHQPLITPDASDPQGHTPIMWAAFQGDALSVDVLLRFGADVKRADQAGLTALHWAVVRGVHSLIPVMTIREQDVYASLNRGGCGYPCPYQRK